MELSLCKEGTQLESYHTSGDQLSFTEGILYLL